MDSRLVRRIHRQVLLVVASAVLAVISVFPWWVDEAPDGEETTFSGWGLLVTAIRWQDAGGTSDGLSWFIASYVTFALVVLTVGVLVPPDVLRPWFGYAEGVLAACLGIGLGAVALVGEGSTEADVEIFAAMHGAWVAALVVSGLWFAWAADRRNVSAGG